MARLKPLDSADDTANVMFSISISQRMADQLDEEQKRIGARSRAELGRMILEEYFKQPIEGE
jgi:metal-responsive CopG/Arc/MetJ family transcriptional regulator